MTRLDRLQSEMKRSATDAVLLSVGADMPHFVGYEAMPLERVTMLVVPQEGEATLWVPELEALRVPAEAPCMVRPWREGADPLDLIADALPATGLVAVADRTWTVFTIGLQNRRPDLSWRSADELTAAIRMVKDSSELDALRSASAAADRVATRIAQTKFSGATETEIARRLSQMLLEEGHDSVDFTIVASGPNAASCHHEPTGRVIEVGDTVVCDFGGHLDGYSSDTTRTFSVGEPSREVAAAHAVLYAAQDAAVSAVRPGVACEDIDRVARRAISEAGYGEWFIHRTGHGIGREMHEHPYICEGNTTQLEPGMAFSIEPGIYVPGSYGMRIEDIVIATSAGFERFNNSDRSLVVVA